MTKEELRNYILSSQCKRNILLELPTGYGKSKFALDVLKFRIPVITNEHKILIVIPRLVLIDNWKKEFRKWKCSKYLKQVQFITYVSLIKLHQLDYDFIIYDECHHLSERCLDYLLKVEKRQCTNILLSATVKRELRDRFKYLFNPLELLRVSVKEASKEGILPEPQVYLLSLQLDNTEIRCKIIKNPKQGHEITISYKDRFKYASNKGQRIIIPCTEYQYYQDTSSYIGWLKDRADNPIFKNLFLRKSGDRLKWLSYTKYNYIQKILSTLKDERTLTFCCDITQTQLYGTNCVNSENPYAHIVLQKFNDGKINHITACNMLDEGVNLTNCRIGIYASLNSSDRMIIQKLGRLLRHPNPIIIIPYYVGTRDEEIVKKMCLNYNEKLIKTITDINQIEL